MQEKSYSSWNPSFIEETCTGKGIIPLRSQHFSDRKVFIDGEITDETANEFVSEFLYLARSDKPADIYMNTPGGSVLAGLLIYDIIQTATFPVNIYCTGLAASMGAIILAGGQKGRRFILPHSKVMIHEPLISGGIGGSATSIKNTADSILETKSILVDIIAKHTGRSKKTIEKAVGFDNFMNAKEAVEFGICDEIRGVL